jgi:hypothetical protein
LENTVCIGGLTANKSLLIYSCTICKLSIHGCRQKDQKSECFLPLNIHKHFINTNTLWKNAIASKAAVEGIEWSFWLKNSTTNNLSTMSLIEKNATIRMNLPFSTKSAQINTGTYHKPSYVVDCFIINEVTVSEVYDALVHGSCI